MPMQVDEAVLQRLLEVQAEDTAIDRLAQRRSSLPEADRLRRVTDTLAELGADIEIARKQNDEIGREHARLEGEIGLLEQKIAREEGRLFSGGVSNPKELSALQAEVTMLKNRRAGLEDALLEVMLQKEQAAETLASLEEEQRAAQLESEELSRVVEGLTGDIDAQTTLHQERRAATARDIPGDLMSLYEKLRSTKGGVGAAALESGTCQGCHTKLPAVEVERLRAERGLQRCDNCRRILVVL